MPVAASRETRAERREARRRAEARRSARRFRRHVARLQPCFYVLPREARRVLAMRAGLGRHRPSSRRRVAKSLDISTSRVRRVERAGLVLLEGADNVSGCGTGGAPKRALSTVILSAASDVPALSAVTYGVDEAAGAATEDAGAVAAARASSPTDPADSGSGTQAGGLTPDAEEATSGPPVLLLLALAAVAGMLLFVVRQVRPAVLGRGTTDDDDPSGVEVEQSIQAGFVEELMKNNPHVSAAPPDPPAASDQPSGAANGHNGSAGGREHGPVGRALKRLLGPKF